MGIFLMFVVGQVIAIRAEEHRSYFPLYHILSYFSLSLAAIQNRPEVMMDGFVMHFSCQAGAIDLVYDFSEMIDHIVDGDRPDVIYLHVREARPPFQGVEIAGARPSSIHISSAVFSLFVDEAVSWVRRNVATDPHRFPSKVNFCRVVRNAIVHGGTVNIDSPNAPIVNWRGLTYGHAQNGREILNNGTDLSIGDLMLLLIEADYELTTLGAPLNLQ